MTKRKVYIDKVYKNPKLATKPTLLKFQNGCLAAVNEETTKFCRIEQQSSKGALVFANKNVYHGLFNEELTDSYICIRSRSTNKVRIIPIEQVTLKNHIYSVLDKTRILRQSTETSQTTLLKQFGGRKGARYVSKKEKMKVNIDMMRTELDATVNEASFTEEDHVLTGEELYNLLRPKYNADAIELKDIYNIADVVPQTLLDRLEEEARTVLSTQIEDLPIKSEYLKEQIISIQNDTPSVEGFLRLKLFIYMEALSNFLKSRARNMNKIVLSNITEKVETDIRHRFSDPKCKQGVRTKLSTEKALCYYIVLALLTGNKYSIDLNTLVEEIGIAKPRIIKFALVSFARKKFGSDVLTLTLPSKIPRLATRKSLPRK